MSLDMSHVSFASPEHIALDPVVVPFVERQPTRASAEQ
jgi:hypothetical protein